MVDIGFPPIVDLAFGYRDKTRRTLLGAAHG
jgi:hypothetical protein